MIYVHIPFCRSFCTYCDFYSEVAAKCRRAEDRSRQEELFAQFSDALGREISQRKAEITDSFNTLYIGGGTPSVLPLSVYASLIENLAHEGIRAPFEEFTFEVNPEDIVEKGETYVTGLMNLGVNRFSMGVQSFDDGILKWMNRRHDAETAVKAYRILEDAGADNISIDLIFGLPQLSDSMWEDTLNKALEISGKGELPRHISSYQLSVEPGSALARLVNRGVWSEASDELCTRQYQTLCEVLGEAGYHHYEISNFAQPGFEAKHNSAYWAHVPYVGLGPGAHSLLIPQSPSVTAPGGIGALSAFPYSHPRIPGPVAASDDALLIPQSPSVTAPGGIGDLSAFPYSHSRIPGPVAASDDALLIPQSPLVAVSEGIGDLSVRRKWNSQDLNAYIADPQSVQEYETLDEQQLVLEKIMLALRTSAGISEDFLKLHVDRSAMEQALKSGDLIPANIPGNLRIPESRFFISDNIVAALV